MHDIPMDAQAVLNNFALVQRLLLLHASLPSNVDGGASERAGLKLRRIKRASAPVVERIEEELEAERIEANRTGRAAEAFAVAAKVILRTSHTLSIPELLTREDWDAIPMQAPHTMPNAGADGQPVTVTLRKTEADLDTLGPLFDEPDTAA